VGLKVNRCVDLVVRFVVAARSMMLRKTEDQAPEVS
jgi:hypothetical protein